MIDKIALIGISLVALFSIGVNCWAIYGIMCLEEQIELLKWHIDKLKKRKKNG